MLLLALDLLGLSEMDQLRVGEMADLYRRQAKLDDSRAPVDVPGGVERWWDQGMDKDTLLPVPESFERCEECGGLLNRPSLLYSCTAKHTDQSEPTVEDHYCTVCGGSLERYPVGGNEVAKFWTDNICQSCRRPM